MKPEPARFALVVYPDNMIGCVFLHAIEDAVKRGAIVFAREDTELCVPVGYFQRYQPYMDAPQSGTDRNTRSQADGHTDDTEGD
jgi:hypothetical protein